MAKRKSRSKTIMATIKAILSGAGLVLLGGLLFFLERWTAPTPPGEREDRHADGHRGRARHDHTGAACSRDTGGARTRIRNNAHLLPYPIRLEGGVSWLHFDVLPQFGITAKVYEFS